MLSLWSSTHYLQVRNDSLHLVWMERETGYENIGPITGLTFTLNSDSMWYDSMKGSVESNAIQLEQVRGASRFEYGVCAAPMYNGGTSLDTISVFEC